MISYSRNAPERVDNLCDRFEHAPLLRNMRSIVNANCVTQSAMLGDMDTPAARLVWARTNKTSYKTPTEAARAFGWSVPTYLGYENGDRNPSRRAAMRIGKAYKVRWEWLLEGQGAPAVGLRSKVVGEIITGQEVLIFQDKAVHKVVDLPAGGGPVTVALQVSGGSMRGIADDGWLIFFDDLQPTPSDDLLGKLCVVETNGGKIYVRTLLKGRGKGKYHLESPIGSHKTISDQKLKWAALVTWIKPQYQ